MGKEGDLWDDSALINAFDDAISKYKKMHSTGGHNSSVQGGKGVSSKEENLSELVDENHGAKRHIQANDNCNVPSNTTKESEGPTTLSPTEDDQCVKPLALEPHIDSSNGQDAQDVLNGYSDTHFELDYNQLLNKYYELEEQRQNILQQLNQFGSWEYQGSGSSVQHGTTSTYQEQQVAAAGASYPPVVCSYCPYGCHSLVAPCTSLNACSLSGPSVEKTCAATSLVDLNSKPFSLEDAGCVKMAMGAAERALSSLKTKASGNDDVNTNEEKEKEVEINVGHLAQSSSSETDLTTVLNAWYLAGFYTGKYLSEQSTTKRRLS